MLQENCQFLLMSYIQIMLLPVGSSLKFCTTKFNLLQNWLDLTPCQASITDILCD